MVEYRGWPLDPLDPCGSLMRVGGTHPGEKVKDREMAGFDLLRSRDRKWGRDLPTDLKSSRVTSLSYVYSLIHTLSLFEL
jgi:hypothetical protein